MTAVTYGTKPFGLKDIKVTEADGTPQADLAAGQTMTFRPIFKSGRMEGDDSMVAAASIMIGLEWSLSAGGMTPEALSVMTGETATQTGTTPNQINTQPFSNQNMPYFKIYGKSLGDGIDDLHVKIFKAKVESIDFSLQDGQFMVTNCSGIAIDDGTNGIFSLIQNETATSLPAS